MDNLPPAPILSHHTALLQPRLRRRHHRRQPREALPAHSPLANRPSLPLHYTPRPAPLLHSGSSKHPLRHLDRRQRRRECLFRCQLGESLTGNRVPVFHSSAETVFRRREEFPVLDCTPDPEDADGAC